MHRLYSNPRPYIYCIHIEWWCVCARRFNNVDSDSGRSGGPDGLLANPVNSLRDE